MVDKLFRHSQPELRDKIAMFIAAGWLANQDFISGGMPISAQKTIDAADTIYRLADAMMLRREVSFQEAVQP